MSGYHAFLSPSGAPAWMLCHLKPWLEKDLPNTSNDAADEGTAAHQLGADCLEFGYRAERDIGRIITVNGTEYEVDQDMADFVQVYVDYVEALLGNHEWYGIEIAVPVAHITGEYVPVSDVGSVEATGTSDAIVAGGEVLDVIDLKYGRGVQVFAQENAQGRIYASGALRILPSDVRKKIKRVRFTIVQPRLGHIDTEELTVEELRDWANGAASIAEDIMAGPDGLVATPGDKQCKFCKVAGTCRARAEHHLALVENEFDVVIDDADAVAAKVAEAKARLPHLAPEELATLMPNLDHIIDWCNAVRAEVTARILGGKPVPGYKAVEGKKGNRAWSDETAVEKLRRRFSKIVPKDDFYTAKLISPTQAEKLLKKAHPEAWDKFNALVVQPPGGYAVVPASDKREALVLGNTADDFAAIEEEGKEG